MSDLPIIFSAPMVRALLEVRKTQTRRIIKQPDTVGGELWVKYPSGWYLTINDDHEYRAKVNCAHGDRLYVREAHAWPEAWDRDECEIARIWYPAGEIGRGRIYDEQKPAGFGKTRPSIHMPRWASRLTLTVTDVRVQRVQDISEADAVEEGCRPFFDEGNSEIYLGPNGAEHRMAPLKGPLDDFNRLWNSLHGPEAWDANPWVAALSFDVHRCNIDQMGAPS